MKVLSFEEDFNIPSPLQELNLKAYPKLSLLIKRDDLIHPAISGNKWRKLKRTIEFYLDNQYSSIVTFGGAFSNHLLATAVVSKKLNIPCHAFIRTEAIDYGNPTINLCELNGMKLHPMSREDYKNKETKVILDKIKKGFPHSLVIPEGGSSSFAISGMEDMINEIKEQHKAKINTYICSLGTAATACGIVSSIYKESNLLIVPAIKGVSYESFSQSYETLTSKPMSHKNINIAYSSQDKSYAKMDLELFRFIEAFLIEHGVLLDPIYTGKAMRFLFQHLDENKEKEQTICFIHTGGIQAWNGYFYRFPKLQDQLPVIFEQIQKFNRRLGL